LRELASRAAVSTSTLSILEAATGNPEVETLVHISGALGVPFSELVMPHEPDVLIQRADQGVVVQAAGADFTSRLLVAASGRSVTEVYEAPMKPATCTGPTSLRWPTTGASRSPSPLLRMPASVCSSESVSLPVRNRPEEEPDQLPVEELVLGEALT